MVHVVPERRARILEKQNAEAVVGSEAGSDLRHRRKLIEERDQKSAELKEVVVSEAGSDLRLKQLDKQINQGPKTSDVMSEEICASKKNFEEQEIDIAISQQKGREGRQERHMIKIRRLSNEVIEKQDAEAVVGSEAGSDLRHRRKLLEERDQKSAELKELKEELFGSEEDFFNK